MRKDELPADWLVQTLTHARDQVAKWPERKKIAYRVIEDPERVSAASAPLDSLDPTPAMVD